MLELVYSLLAPQYWSRHKLSTVCVRVNEWIIRLCYVIIVTLLFIKVNWPYSLGDRCSAGVTQGYSVFIRQGPHAARQPILITILYWKSILNLKYGNTRTFNCSHLKYLLLFKKNVCMSFLNHVCWSEVGDLSYSSINESCCIVLNLTVSIINYVYISNYYTIF